MKRLLIILAFAAGSAESKKFHMNAIQVIGFTCTAKTGAVKRMNIDLSRSMYQDDNGIYDLENVTDGKVLLHRQSPSLMNTPMGPVFHTLEIDRRTLVLSEHVAIPDRSVNRFTDYQCVAGGPIDFTAGRQF
jgi:hypothetical protein